MRRVSFVLVMTALGCGSASPPAPASAVIETDATSYVATPLTTPGVHSHHVQVIAKIRNIGNDIVRVSRCTSTTTYPPYGVNPAGDGEAAWNPNLTCNIGAPYQDLPPGAERTDTLQLLAPWSRTLTGEPVGVIDGRFYILYDTRICGRVSANGLCQPDDVYEVVRSNEFTISR